MRWFSAWTADTKEPSEDQSILLDKVTLTVERAKIPSKLSSKSLEAQ
jgi:hypothetical protein